MKYKYAQIDPATGKCMTISYLSDIVDAPYMVLLADEDSVNFRDVWDSQTSTWIPAPPEEPQREPQSLQDQIADLNAQNVQLWELLISKGVI